MPMFIGRRKVATFSFLSKKIEHKLQGWQNNPLSKAGKLTLLKTAAHVVPNFWMGKGIKWLAWEKLCSFKKDGGLGCKSLREFSTAMLAKQAWRIINGINPLVTSIMQAQYFPNSSFLEAKMGANLIYVWRSLMQTQEVMRQGCRRRIGNGKSTRIWQVPWLKCPVNGYITTIMPEELKEARVENLFAENRKEWDEDVLKDIFNERDYEQIRNIQIPLGDRKDKWVWSFDDKGNSP
ncbi:putative mitochondrial protein AtMg00310 [Apium graveolens]|uniref:putative mitochondrial protein AtMg00310 n=1 Tax=Apium graveolens TaxID=4045 RepID=UPI003D793BCC